MSTKFLILVVGILSVLLFIYLACLELQKYNIQWQELKSAHKNVNAHKTMPYRVIEEAAVNTTWNLRRTDGGVSKVLILAYMRGGSSIFQELFNQQSSVSWYEPLDSFYSAYYGIDDHILPLNALYHDNNTRRIQSELEHTALIDFIEQLLEINIEALPLETLVHSFLYQTRAFRPVVSCLTKIFNKRKGFQFPCLNKLHKSCGNDSARPNMSCIIGEKYHESMNAIRTLFNASELNNVLHVKERLESTITQQPISMSRITGLVAYQQCALSLTKQIRSCWRNHKTRLSNSKLISAKFIRLSLADLEGLLHRIPDLHIIHLIRDPRAIVTSRIAKAGGPVLTRMEPQSVSEESRFFCTRMKDDLIAKRILEAKYPSSIMTVRYEDYVLSAALTIKRAFEFVGQPEPVGIRSYIFRAMHAFNDSGRFGTVRVNALNHIDQWRTKVNHKDILIMNTHCSAVLANYGYNI